MTPKEALKEIEIQITTYQAMLEFNISDWKDDNKLYKPFDTINRTFTELEELKKDIARFLYLQTGRIPFTGDFTQDFVIENKSHPLAHEYVVERNLKREYKEIKEKLERLGK